jgi:Zn-dependent protease
MDWITPVIQVIALLISLSFHEFSHGLTAYLLGDRTAQQAGRLTLNPLKHIDWFGTVILPLMLMFGGYPVFGWAKPVPYNPFNLRLRRWGPAVVAASGPVSNFMLATIFLFSLKYCLTVLHLPDGNLLLHFLMYLTIVNIILGTFNLIPIAPLDGSALLEVALHGPRWQRLRFFLESKGPTILILLVVLDAFSPTPILGSIFNTVIGWFFALGGMA